MKKFTKVMMPVFLMSSIFLASCSNDDKATEEKTEETETTEEGSKSEIAGRDLVKNVHVRRAIALGFDKKYLVEEIIADGSREANYFFPAEFSTGPDGKDFREDAPEYLEYNLEEAQKEWQLAKEELGFETCEIDLTNFDDDVAKVVAEYIKSDLEQNLEGLTVNIKPLPLQQKLDESAAGNFAINYSMWGADYLDPSTFFGMWVSDGKYNEAGYSNAEYDKNATLPTTDAQARWDGFIEAERILLEEDTLLAPIYQRTRTFLQDPAFEGVVRHPYGSGYTYNWVVPKTDDKQLDLLETTKTPTLDPNMSGDGVSYNQLNAIDEGLLRLGKEGDNIIPGLAESFEKSEDGLEYTFKLRDGLNFVDSTGKVVEPLTAQSFVDAWDRLKDPANAAPNGYMVEDVAHIKSYEAVDETTFKVTLSEDTPWFESILTSPPFFPVASAKAKELGTTYGTTQETTFSCGPFYLSEWDFSEKVVLLKNDNYHSPDDIKIDSMNFRVIEGAENNTAVSMYFADELDRTVISGENAKTYKDHDDFVNDVRPSMVFLDFYVGEE